MNDKQIEEIISQYKTLAQNIREGIIDLTNQDITNIVTILKMCLQYCDGRPHNDIVSKANELLHKTIESYVPIFWCPLLNVFRSFMKNLYFIIGRLWMLITMEA